MRLSTNHGDPGYRAWRQARKHGAKAIVRLDGVEMRDCITADTKRGYVVLAMRDDKGDLRINPKRDKIPHALKHGRVEIAMQHDPQLWRR